MGSHSALHACPDNPIKDVYVLFAHLTGDLPLFTRYKRRLGSEILG